MKISVIIPAFNAQETLPDVLSSLVSQIRKDDEIIVVDDGSDVPLSVLSAIGAKANVVRQSHAGPAAARNLGAKIATGDIFLFLGADIIPLPGLISFHSTVHQQYPSRHIGCLGYVTWDPAVPPSPWMVYLEHGGPQNAYDEIAGQQWVCPESYFYAANISIKASLFRSSEGFDAHRFSSYGWEDLEFGIRLAREHQCTLYYEPLARGIHRHKLTARDSIRRMKSVGKGARKLRERYPDVQVIRQQREWWAYPLRALVFPWFVQAVLVRIACVAEHRYLLPGLYGRILSLAFFEGYYSKSSRYR